MGRVQIFNVSGAMLGTIFCKPVNETMDSPQTVDLPFTVHLEADLCNSKAFYICFFIEVLFLFRQYFCLDGKIKTQQKENKTCLEF